MQNLEPTLIFITVAEMGSFTHAADSLGNPKGSVANISNGRAKPEDHIILFCQ